MLMISSGAFGMGESGGVIFGADDGEDDQSPYFPTGMMSIVTGASIPGFPIGIWTAIGPHGGVFSSNGAFGSAFGGGGGGAANFMSAVIALQGGDVVLGGVSAACTD